jgi:hypothetical protein
VSDTCPECECPLLWTGHGWSAHSTIHHAIDRQRLYREIASHLDQAAELKAWLAGNGAGDFVGIRWRCGVYPGWQSEMRTSVSREIWEALGRHAGGRERVLAHMRAGLADHFREVHGVKVNPATWFHKVYDIA